MTYHTLYTSDGSAITPGMAIQLQPAHDLWMMGYRFGTVREIYGKKVSVELHRFEHKIIRRISPSLLLDASN